MGVRNCPNCGSDEIAHGYSCPPMMGTVECYADGCEILTVADSEYAAISRWNAGIWDYRVVDRDDDGNPVYEAAK